MAVKFEIKSQLAKLLATEDLIVEHKQVETAQFNVHTRVLILPLWEKASNVVYDMLVGHEVGHALFTPDEWDWMNSVPQTFVNVVEDARIEKLIKRKYMGIAKTFYKAYNELHEKNFFELDGEDISNLNLADRANLHFKIGSFLNIPFSTPEQEIITLIENAETFTDTIAAAEALYNFCKQEKQQEQEQISESEQEDLEQDTADNIKGSGDLSTDPSSGDESSSSNDDTSSPMEDGDSIDVNNSGSHADSDSIDEEPEVKTAESLADKLQDLANSDGIENTYLEIPEVNLDTIIASNEDVHKLIDDDFASQQVRFDENLKEKGPDYWRKDVVLFNDVDQQFFKFKRSAQKEVNYLVKEFEMKKSASAYARAATSRTGVLDTSALHTYKFNEDIFKKITVLPDGKNHGLVFILDWSGSMQYVLQDTCKQLFNLMWFCKKVHIPFEVYAFTNEWRMRTEKGDEDPNRYGVKLTPHAEPRENDIVVDEDFALMNMFTSKVNVKTLEQQMINVWRMSAAYGNQYQTWYQVPYAVGLSGTPLNETLITLHQILPKFQKEYKLEKAHCIVLTDGEAGHLPYYKEVERDWEDKPYMGKRNVNPNHCVLRDRKLGKTYTFDYGWHTYTNTLLYNLKDRFPTVNFIGIRVINPREAKRFIKMHEPFNEKLIDTWRKSKSCVITKSGYDAYIAMSADNLADDSEFDVDDEATKAQIKRAFVKSLKVKKLNKKVLSEFISLVA